MNAETRNICEIAENRKVCEKTVMLMGEKGKIICVVIFMLTANVRKRKALEKNLNENKFWRSVTNQNEEENLS